MRNEVSAGHWVEYEDAGKGRPVVLLHAFPLSRAMWRPQLEALRGASRVIVPDLRGFGGTGAFGGPPSVEQMADDVVALLDALGVREPVVLGGLSMGGYVALAFARRHPNRLRGLILADTRAEPDGDEAKSNRNKMITFAEDHPPDDVIDQLLPKLVSDETRTRRREVVEEVRRIAREQSPAGIIRALEALRDRPDAGPTLADIQAPTLVIVGSEDQLTPPAAAKTLAEGIRGARLVTIAGAGHLSNLEQPEKFIEAVRSFLGSLP